MRRCPGSVLAFQYQTLQMANRYCVGSVPFMILVVRPDSEAARDSQDMRLQARWTMINTRDGPIKADLEQEICDPVVQSGEVQSRRAVV